LLNALEPGKVPVSRQCEAQVGEDDWQSVSQNVSMLGELLGITVHVVPVNGHMLYVAYVSQVLDGWLA